MNQTREKAATVGAVTVEPRRKDRTGGMATDVIVSDNTRPVNRCELCGADEDVLTTRDYLGGVGYVTRHQCTNLVDCWSRADLAHDLNILLNSLPPDARLRLLAAPSQFDGVPW